MQQKKKKEIPTEKKIKAVKDLMEGNHSLRELAKTYNVHHSSIEQWVIIYQTFGEKGLCHSNSYTKYPEKLKTDAVEEYLNSERSLRDICKEYKIRSISLLQYWIERYKEREPQLKL